jgi:hypothetical protein
MKSIATSIEIAAPPSRVWSVLADVARWSEWNPFVRSFEGKLEEGARVTVKIGPPGKTTTTFRPCVLAASSEKGIRWLGRLGLPGIFDGEHHIGLEPLDGGRTRVHHSEQFRGLLVPLLGGLLRETEKGFHAMNQALKARVEGGAV